MLVDPVFSRRVGVDLGLFTAGPGRLQRPAVKIGELPKIDWLLLTHAHFDHLDRPTLHRLPKDCDVVLPHGCRDLVDDLGFRSVTELRPGLSRFADGPCGIEPVVVRHWGPRVFLDAHRGYCGYVLRGPGGRVLHAGDTADTDLGLIGPFDLGTFGIGAYDPYLAAHATPEQAWRMAEAAGCRRFAAMHHTTFRLSHEPTAEPLRRLERAADPARVVIRRVGERWVRPA